VPEPLELLWPTVALRSSSVLKSLHPFDGTVRSPDAGREQPSPDRCFVWSLVKLRTARPGSRLRGKEEIEQRRCRFQPAFDHPTTRSELPALIPLSKSGGRPGVGHPELQRRRLIKSDPLQRQTI
jgi:hypothetical protein